MKKIFVLTGEPSGDKLASKVISKLKKIEPNIEYLSLGGENLKAIGIESIFNINEVTYLGFTRVLLNIFKIKKKINETANKILEFKPDILFSVDSPDFTLRVAKIVKQKLPSVKTVHFVAPQVWVWREGRVKKIKEFIDHILLLFKFEKKYFEKENISCEFIGHPLLEEESKSIEENQSIIKKKAIISIFPGSRVSEINRLVPILIKFIKLMNKKYDDFYYVFHTTTFLRELLDAKLKKSEIDNYEITSNEIIKNHILKKSIFAVAKSGTVSLEICNKKIPSVIIYKMNFINYLIIKILIKIKFANLINIAAKKMIIPELIQSNCNSSNIFKVVSEFIENPDKIKNQINETQVVLDSFKTKNLPTDLAANSLRKIISL
tara:strand:- start:2748 stop:3881 length:1134 start_codon:yes stop_codon:yes gene_type:complete